jgi:formamidopyrimidine-DNA glycosylase
MLKPLLLRQDVVSGVGNILADESLWEARLHPARRVETFGTPEIERLYRALVRVIKRLLQSHEVRTGADCSAEAVFGSGFRVYGKKGEPCRRCRAPIEKITLANRGTVFCPKCQGK